MTFPIRIPAWKLKGIVKIIFPEAFHEMKPLEATLFFLCVTAYELKSCLSYDSL